MKSELEEKDLVEEVTVECGYVLEQAAQDEGPPRPAWTRIKGYDSLSPESLAVLRSLAIARETVAESRDVPPFRVAPNDVLLTLARRLPRSLRDVRRHRGVRGAELAHTFYEAVEAGRRAGAIPAEERPTRTSPIPSRAQREADQRLKKRLTEWRRTEAERRGVPAQAVLPGHCVTDLVALRPASRDELHFVPGFGDVRVDRYADAIVGLLTSP